VKHRFVPLNHVTVSGRCTHDPEVRYTKEGLPCCDFQIAFNSCYNGKQTAHFIQIAAFAELATTAGKLRKGLAVVIVGELRDSKVIGKNGMYSRPKVLANKIWRFTEDEREDALDAVYSPPVKEKPTKKEKPPVKEKPTKMEQNREGLHKCDPDG